MAMFPSGGFEFDPGKVLMGGPSAGNSPYMRAPVKYPTPSLPGGGTVSVNGSPGSTTVPSQIPPPGSTTGADAIRATGSGPYDPAYRQNLATYAGGQFFQPGGSLSFNPTGNLFGNPTGGGNAPVMGTGTGLLDRALGGQPFSYAAPAPQQSPTTPDATNLMGNWQDWIRQLRQQGNGFAMNLM